MCIRDRHDSNYRVYVLWSICFSARVLWPGNLDEKAYANHDIGFSLLGDFRKSIENHAKALSSATFDFDETFRLFTELSTEIIFLGLQGLRINIWFLFEFIDCNPFFGNFACVWSRDTRAIFFKFIRSQLLLTRTIFHYNFFGKSFRQFLYHVVCRFPVLIYSH